jgi:hypothetical protein
VREADRENERPPLEFSCHGALQLCGEIVIVKTELFDLWRRVGDSSC